MEQQENKACIVSVLSEMGEQLRLASAVKVDDDLDVCLRSLEHMISSSLESQLEHPNTAHPCTTQILSLAASIQFTHEVENAMRTGRLSYLKEELQEQLLSFSNQKNWRDDALERMRGSVMVMDYIHHIDTLEHLIQSQVLERDDWEWNKTLRFYKKVSSFLNSYMSHHFKCMSGDRSFCGDG